MQPKVAATKAQQKKPRLVPPAPSSRDEAIALILAPLERGDGFRHVALGAPGYGKTFWLRELVAAVIESNACDLVLTHDTKGSRPEFEGTELVRAADLPSRAAELEQTRHAVFRGDARADIVCEAEDVACVGKRIAQKGARVLLVVGELDECLSEGGRSWRAPTVRWFSSQGRQLGACLAATTQQPKRTPDEVFDQATSIAFFNLDARSSNYLSNTLLLDEAMVAKLPALGVGEFVLRIQGRPWDGRVYRSDR